MRRRAERDPPQPEPRASLDVVDREIHDRYRRRTQVWRREMSRKLRSEMQSAGPEEHAAPVAFDVTARSGSCARSRSGEAGRDGCTVMFLLERIVMACPWRAAANYERSHRHVDAEPNVQASSRASESRAVRILTSSTVASPDRDRKHEVQTSVDDFCASDGSRIPEVRSAVREWTKLRDQLCQRCARAPRSAASTPNRRRQQPSAMASPWRNAVFVRLQRRSHVGRVEDAAQTTFAFVRRHDVRLDRHDRRSRGITLAIRAEVAVVLCASDRRRGSRSCRFHDLVRPERNSRRGNVPSRSGSIATTAG